MQKKDTTRNPTLTQLIEVLFSADSKPANPFAHTLITANIKAGRIPYNRLLFWALQPVKYNPFQRRLYEIKIESEDKFMVFRGTDHQKHFTQFIADKPHLDKTKLAAIYLLTADNVLWLRMKKSIGKHRIDFNSAIIGEVSSEAYIAYHTARDICQGSNHICLSDLTNRDVISHRMFTIICNALTICRYGLNAIKAMEWSFQNEN